MGAVLPLGLGSGGKVLWLGMPPLMWPPDPKTGERSMTSFDRSAGTRLLGVDHTPANFDPRGSRVKGESRRHSLPGAAARDPRTKSFAFG